MRDNYDYVAGDDTIVPPGKPAADDLFNDGVYYRGALALHALRLKVGDDMFFSILRTWYEALQGWQRLAPPTSSRWRTNSAAHDLTGFFDGWLTRKPCRPSRRWI